MNDRLHIIAAVASVTALAALSAIIFVAVPARAHERGSDAGAFRTRVPFAERAAATLAAARVDALMDEAPLAVHGRCADTVDVPGQGRSCRLASGLWGVKLASGSTVSTHGPDFLAASAPVLATDDELGLTEAGDITGHPDDSAYVACALDPTQPHYRAIYARRKNSSDTAAAVIANMRAALRQASQFTKDQSAVDLAAPGAEARLRFLCTPDHAIDIKTVEVASATSIDIATLQSQLGAVGANSGPDRATTRMVVYYDGKNSSGAAGQGSIYPDSSPSATNQNNGSEAIAVQYLTKGMPFWDVFLHEMMHNMGATQDGSPGSNGHGHCTEDADVMCYDEYGVRTAAKTGCVKTQLDCGNDTYFNANASPTGWLATHWNAGSPVNRWLDFGTRNIDTLPPSVPQLPRILATTTTTATIEWDPSVDQSTELTYRVHARAADGRVTVTAAGPATTSVISGLTPGAQYFFAIDATDASGNVSARGAEQAVILPAPPLEATTVPSAPTKLSITGIRGEAPGNAGTGHTGNLVTGAPDARSPTRLAVSGIKGTKATLLWSPGTSGGTVTSFRIILKDEATGSLRSMTAEGSERSAAIVLPAGYVTTIRVVAVAAAGSASSAPIKAVGSRSATGCTWVAGDTTAPTKPRGLRLVTRLTTALGVRWAASADRNGVCAYRRVKLVRGRWLAAGPPIAPRPLATTILGLRRGTAQRVAIQAIDAAGNLSPRAELVSRTR